MINCKEIAERKKEEYKKNIEESGVSYTLSVIQVEGDKASDSYVKGKKKDCEEVGINFRHIVVPRESTTQDVRNIVLQQSNDREVDGVMVQLPLPKHMDKDLIVEGIDWMKDVDGMRIDSLFTKCTPKGVMMVLEDLGVSVDGKVCLVVGRGEVGRPMVDLLNDNGATIVWCNSHTKRESLVECIGIADIIVTAVGKPGLISDVSLDGKIVIDVGISVGEDGKLYGDVSKDLYTEEAMITPVPGGAGLMTRLALLDNIMERGEIVS